MTRSLELQSCTTTVSSKMFGPLKMFLILIINFLDTKCIRKEKAALKRAFYQLYLDISHAQSTSIRTSAIMDIKLGLNQNLDNHRVYFQFLPFLFLIQYCFFGFFSVTFFIQSSLLFICSFTLEKSTSIESWKRISLLLNVLIKHHTKITILIH